MDTFSSIPHLFLKYVFYYFYSNALNPSDNVLSLDYFLRNKTDLKEHVPKKFVSAMGNFLSKYEI